MAKENLYSRPFHPHPL